MIQRNFYINIIIKNYVDIMYYTDKCILLNIVPVNFKLKVSKETKYIMNTMSIGNTSIVSKDTFSVVT